ncbi:MFS transporter [Catenulispora sp. NF23]|uniref:MFS transporter n=1 Tax=Catenulispora pinistramenti TaxID=2705254 RepID=UPI001BAD9A01|nr:MFS transporter [Catenulispora pinistramenti]MBS2531515.1 MFS transporter [Catenulispora pinistramenti]
MRFATALRPLAHKTFRRQFTAQAVSMTGTALAPVAMTFGVLNVTGSAAALSLVLASYSAPQLALMVVGGVWADRLPRHRVMMTTDATRFLAQTTFGICLLTGHAPLAALMALQVLNGVASAFNAPARLGLTKATAPPGMFQQASALLAVTNDVTTSIGPLIAGVLAVSIGPGWALIIDGGTYLGSSLLLSSLRLPSSQRTGGRFGEDVREGWQEVRKRTWLWTSVAYFSLFNLVYAIFVVLGPAQLHSKHGSALQWGVVVAAMSIGSLCGNALALRLTTRYLLRWPRAMQFAAIPLIVALALNAPSPVLTGAAFLMGLVISFPDALWYTALQQEVPGPALSRVSSFDMLGSTAGRPLGYALAAVLLRIGSATSLLAVAAVFFLATAATLAVRDTRHLARAPAVEPAPEQDSPGSGEIDRIAAHQTQPSEGPAHRQVDQPQRHGPSSPQVAPVISTLNRSSQDGGSGRQ